MKTLLSRMFRMIRLSLPLAAMEVPVVATVAIDTVALGRIDSRAVAAGGLGAAVFLFISSVFVSVISSVGHEAAYREGRRDGRGVRGTLYGGVALSCALGFGATIATVAAAPFLGLLGQDVTVADEAAVYLYAIAPGLPFLLLAVCFRGMASSQPSVVRLVGVAASTVGVKALLVVLAWTWVSTHDTSGRSGLLFCGATTSLTFLAMSVSAGGAYFRSKNQRSNAAAAMEATTELTATGAHRIARRGLTIGLTTALQSGFFTVAAVFCGQCGAADLAAHQVANQCTLVPLMLAFGMSQATATLTSRALGAGLPAEAKRASWDAIFFSIVTMGAVAIVLVIAGHAAIDVILPARTSDRDHVAAIAWQLVLVGACCLLADGAQNVAMGALRGLGHGSLTIHSSIAAYWMAGVPLAWWLGKVCGLGATGVWLGVGAGLHVSAIVLLYFLYRTTRAARSEAPVNA